MYHIIAMVQVVTPERHLYEYGILGIIVVVLALAARKLFNIILNDRDKAIGQRDILLEDTYRQVLPVLTKSTELVQSGQALDKELLEAIKRLDKSLQDNKGTLDRIELILLGRGHGHIGGP